VTTLPPSCAVVVKSGNLNFLESSGPLQASNGTDLPLPFSSNNNNDNNNNNNNYNKVAESRTREVGTTMVPKK